MNSEETLYAVAMAGLRWPKLSLARQLYQTAGSARTVFDNRKDLSALIDRPSSGLEKIVARMDEALLRAEQEMAFAERHGIRILTLSDADYPYRVSQCSDAPLVLFYRGKTDLNARHIVSVVGTRRCTDYGKEVCRHFVSELGRLLPDVLVVSGLAYGIDIHAHRAALDAGLSTVGVLAHGLDRIYPSSHRDTARQMLDKGGLITEFSSNTEVYKGNFVRRNRIIAALADACVVVESATKGGGLITAGMAQSYDREVFAFPGRVTDVCSEGCNRLIVQNGASLLVGAEQLVSDMQWKTLSERNVPKEGNLFVELSSEEQSVVSALRESDGRNINQLVTLLKKPVSELMPLLLGLEMKGLIRALPGSVYKSI